VTDLLLYAAVLIGVAAAGYLVARSPQFWVGLAMVVGQRLWPLMLKMFARKSPEDEVAWRKSYGEGRKDDPR